MSAREGRKRKSVDHKASFGTPEHWKKKSKAPEGGARKPASDESENKENAEPQNTAAPKASGKAKRKASAKSKSQSKSQSKATTDSATASAPAPQPLTEQKLAVSSTANSTNSTQSSTQSGTQNSKPKMSSLARLAVASVNHKPTATAPAAAAAGGAAAVATMEFAPAPALGPVTATATAPFPAADAVVDASASEPAKKSKTAKGKRTAKGAGAATPTKAAAAMSVSPKSATRRVLMDINEQSALQRVIRDKTAEVAELQTSLKSAALTATAAAATANAAADSALIAEWKEAVNSKQREYERAVEYWKAKAEARDARDTRDSANTKGRGGDKRHAEAMESAVRESVALNDKLKAAEQQFATLKADHTAVTNQLAVYRLLTGVSVQPVEPLVAPSAPAPPSSSASASASATAQAFDCKAVNPTLKRAFPFRLTLGDGEVAYEPNVKGIQLNGSVCKPFLKETIEFELSQTPGFMRWVLAALNDPVPSASASASASASVSK